MAETLDETEQSHALTAQMNRVMETAGYFTLGHCDISFVSVGTSGYDAEVLEIHRVRESHSTQHDWTHQFITNQDLNHNSMTTVIGPPTHIPHRTAHLFFRKPGLEDVVFEREEIVDTQQEDGVKPKPSVTTTDRTLEGKDRQAVRKKLDQVEGVLGALPEAA